MLKSAADPAETERPPKLNNRESLLPPRIGKLLDNSSVQVVKSGRTTKEGVLSDKKDQKRASIESLKESASDTCKDTGRASTNNSLSATLFKSKSFLNKQALKKLINE